MYQYFFLTALVLWATGTLAGYNPGASDNIAIYWGQNSAGAVNAGQSQQSLSEYCSNTEIDIIPIAFLSNFNPIELDLTNMDDDKNMGEEIAACQKAGKTVLLSIGGSMFNSGPSDPQAAADQVWSMFGPGSGNNRPFGNTVVDGFDLDIEAPIQNIAPFAARLRQNIDNANNAGGGQKFYLSAAPQCPWPDQNNDAMLQGNSAVAFDFIMVQFYNNAKCDIRVFDGSGGTSSPAQAGFNMDQWDQWAHSSKNPNAKVFLGIPGGPSAVTSSEKASYKAPDQLGPIIAYSKKFASFGGVMIWDMSQVWANPGFLDAISNDVKCPPAQNAARRSSDAAVRRVHQREWKL
ncbi:glycoside hydrolase family 18 protein [Hypoxylon trugodes]|uniref:glycoside hydrolase family 18 protein n=1 Tax=Hypoxylon trugodes TaxID=326681 RepID=UPI00218D0CA1|nr:glycoside hydrolase family 18 protein [Hypoxylon trugodes]KAI1382840.1 glycoside hydrolase family 18 protein [Hypoxylon trugodes]